MLAESISIGLQLACALLLLASGAAVWALWTGCRVLRGLARVNTRDDSPYRSSRWRAARPRGLARLRAGCSN